MADILDISGTPTSQEPTLSELYMTRQRRRDSLTNLRPSSASSGGSGAPRPPPPPPTLPEAESRLREAVTVYIRTRDAAKAPYDPSVPRISGMWIMSPAEDGKSLHDNAAGSMLEVTSDIEIRDTASDCPWPYWVYKNHVEHELAKGEDCPIKGVPLSSCLVLSVSMNCGHLFDHAAIVTWASRKADFPCPVCRTPIAGLWHFRSKK